MLLRGNAVNSSIVEVVELRSFGNGKQTEVVRLPSVLRRRNGKRGIVEGVCGAERLATGIHIGLATKAQRLPETHNQTSTKSPMEPESQSTIESKCQRVRIPEMIYLEF